MTLKLDLRRNKTTSTEATNEIFQAARMGHLNAQMGTSQSPRQRRPLRMLLDNGSERKNRVEEMSGPARQVKTGHLST
ncbi:hypothetical protein Y032_0194g1440 [Ancylostoma ceylanicum]|uniref:Uncharacterized protein n=1 Tax=Ancylostoma ceylanicum TaxID=53326 RepID=A0A016SP85_9BILA|nr:hypothetical protein Y032_0194g1440 [Ancylostoma ceylanicum]